jgi:protein required for attachment to host cells
MDVGGVTWIVTADAVEARIFAERVRSGAVKEMEDLRMSATDAERGAGQKQRATVHDRHGHGRHGAGEHTNGDEATRRFLKRVANCLALAAGRGEFDKLVLMGPPRALGVLKEVLPDSLAGRVETTDPHERKRDTADDVRQHLREARARMPAA